MVDFHFLGMPKFETRNGKEDRHRLRKLPLNDLISAITYRVTTSKMSLNGDVQDERNSKRGTRK